MNFKNKLNQIKALLSMEVKLEQMMLEDGITAIEAESFEAGFSVGIVTEEGLIPVPVGEYKLEDGSEMKVEVEGIIASIEMPEAEAPAEEQAPVAEEEVAMNKEPKKVIESVSKEMFFSELQKFEDKYNEMKSSYESKIQALTVQLSEQPAASAINYNPESKVEAPLYKGNANKRGFSIADRVSNMLHNQ